MSGTIRSFVEAEEISYFMSILLYAVKVKNVTTSNLKKQKNNPILFNLKDDPGEKKPIDSKSKEYFSQINIMKKIVRQHKESFESEGGFGKPDLNYCTSNWCEGKSENCRKNVEVCEWKH